MQNLDLLSKRILIVAFSLSLVLLSGSVLVYSLNSVTKSNAQQILNNDNKTNTKTENELEDGKLTVNTTQLSVTGTGDGGYVICVGIYDDVLYYVANGKLQKEPLKKAVVTP